MIYIELFGMQVNVLAQICGLIGLAVILFAYQLKKAKYLFAMLIGYAFCIGESALCFAFINVLITGIAVLRNVLQLIFLTKKGKELPLWITLLMLAVMWGGCVPFFVANFVWFDIIPPILVSINTLAAINKNYYVLKIGAFCQESGFMPYHFYYGAYIGVFRQIVLSIGVIVSIVRMIINNRKRNNDNSAENKHNGGLKRVKQSANAK